MKKAIPILIIGMLVASGLGAVAIQEQDDRIYLTQTEQIIVKDPTINKVEQYIMVDIEDTAQLIRTGKPVIPVVTKTMKLPVGSIIENTYVDINYQSIGLEAQIKPSPAPVALSMDDVQFTEKNTDLFNEAIYQSAELYPSEAYEVNYGVGIDEGQRVTYVNIRCNAQYSPANNVIHVPKTIEITVDYSEPLTSPIAATEYDLLIVTDEKFEDEMIRLKNHKDSIGISTKVVTVDTILDAYDGVADWEEVKMFMFDEIIEYGVTYVLFAGGRMGQTEEWWVPAFYSNNRDGAVHWGAEIDRIYTADLYFADVIQYNQFGFPELSTWDTNDDGVYARGPLDADYDNPDFYPDVHFGRLPIRYSWDATACVDKIIYYESMPANPAGFKKVVLCGGDTSPEERYPGQAERDIYEGEMVCDQVAIYLAAADFTSYKMYTSTFGDYWLNDGEDGDDAEAVAAVLNQGCGWVDMQGHANPAVLGNHIMDREDFVYFYTMMDMNLFSNDQHILYPYMVCDGCHNAQFDVTVQEVIDNGGINYPGAGALEFIPCDIGSWMVLKDKGGGIGLIGNQVFGYGYLNDGILSGLGGWIMPRFAHAYAIQGKEYSGEIWTQGVTDYINTFDIYKDEVDRKTVEGRTFLGDPSVKLGGGAGKLSSEDTEETTTEYMPAATANVPTWSVGDSWTYKINEIDFEMSEIEGRGVDLFLSAGNINLEVVDVSTHSYITAVSCDDLDLEIAFEYDSHNSDNVEIVIPPMKFDNVQLAGQIKFEKDTLAFESVDLTMTLDVVENLDNLADIIGMQLPAFIDILKPYMDIPALIDLTVDFDEPWPLIQFPMEEGSEWGIPAGDMTITIGGSVESVWLRILAFVNKFIPIIPPEFAQYLPNVDIAEVLEDMGIPSEIQVPIGAMDVFLRKPIFQVAGQQSINVDAGTFTATRVKFVGGIGNLYYSEQAKNFVQIYSPAQNFLPAITNINLELVE